MAALSADARETCTSVAQRLLRESSNIHSDWTRRKFITTAFCSTRFFSGVALSLCALCSMVTGFGTLQLLCKTTQSVPADVRRQVQQYLRVHVGQRCPSYLDDLFVQQLQALGPNSEVVFTLSSSLRLDFTSRYNWDFMGFAGADDQDTDVTVKFTLWSSGYQWTVTCAQNGAVLMDNCGMEPNSKSRRPSILSCLRNSRKCFVCPDTESRGALEVPGSLQQWRSFFMLWLFNEAPALQTTLLRWMRAAPAECCPMCKQPAPRQCNAFCSAQCAEAYKTLSCRISRRRAPWFIANCT